MTGMNELIDGMSQGREWGATGDSDAVRTLLGRVYDERYHSAAYHKDRFQLRVNLQKKDDAASYAGWITAENPTSGPSHLKVFTSRSCISFRQRATFVRPWTCREVGPEG